MGFNKKDLLRVKEEYSDKYRKAQDDSDRRRSELWGKIDGLYAIDKELSLTGLRIMDVAMSGESDVGAKIEKIMPENTRMSLNGAKELGITPTEWVYRYCEDLLYK